MPNKKQDENKGLHMTSVISSVPCTRHAAEVGSACWNVLTARGIMRAICNKRAQNAGCNGKITEDLKSGNAHDRYSQKG